ncbi:hypothetical protein [Halobacteriovorax sp. HLS]|uniref:hypothetical protein n=1 Tax=Halobacteriovorax sp. HLS TaxID=2234000 RepID=UPI000FDC4DBB|nr:hypothetical protein [Halobacteriovorax sp. HLS]
MKTNNDFKKFVTHEKDKTPRELKEDVCTQITTKLNPSHALIYSKLLTSQLFFGVISLTFCPQFELSLTNNYDLFHYFHRTFGAHICMILCGAVFMGAGAILSSLLLSITEIKKIYQSRFLYFTSLTGIFISLFFVYGVEIYLKMASLWAIGSIVSAIVIFKSAITLRDSLREVH